MAIPPDTQATNPTRTRRDHVQRYRWLTAIMGRDEQEGLEARNAHRELLRNILPRFTGRLLGDLGDGALSSFQAAIATLERPLSASEGAQKWAQFPNGAKPELPN
jgi:hypothetical protein